MDKDLNLGKIPKEIIASKQNRQKERANYCLLKLPRITTEKTCNVKKEKIREINKSKEERWKIAKQNVRIM